jgi:hypothetical protein
MEAITVARMTNAKPVFLSLVRASLVFSPPQFNRRSIGLFSSLRPLQFKLFWCFFRS